MIWIIRIFAMPLLLVTLLPLLPTGKWYVRGWDFPRLQITVLLCIILTVSMGIGVWYGWSIELICWTLAVLVALFWQGSHVIHFSPFWRTEAADADPDSPITKIMIANLKFDNDHYEAVQREIADEDADILMLIEIDTSWYEKLAGLREKFDYHHEDLRDDGLGLALWSKHAIHNVETREVVSKRRPSIWAEIDLVGGQRSRFVGVHPTPPGLQEETGDSRRDSRERDAELVLVAKQIAEQENESWIVGGDFNDVAWSHTTRLFKRISGLNDPRVGRSFMGTFIANVPILRVPMDHLFLSKGFTVQRLTRKRITGSDHFSVIAEINLPPQKSESEKGVSPEKKNNDQNEAEKMVEEGKDDARERGLR